MKKTVTILGCATEYLPVIFDICFDTFGSTTFNIYKNVKVDSAPEMPVTTLNYSIHLVEPGNESKISGDEFIFGVNGPFAKFKVFNDFYKRSGVNRSDYLTLKHPTCIVAPSALIEEGVLLEPGVIVSSQTIIGFGVTAKRQVCIGHHCKIGEYVEINPGVTISGHVNIGKGCIIGSGSVIRNGITIGENSFIGMGSVVTKDIPAGVVAFGSPCKVIRKHEKQLIP